MSSFLIRTKNEDLLFDTGMGGLLLPSLEAIGLGADDIDAIFITHLHPDHIGGLVKDGNAVFKNAKLYISNDEYNGTIGADAEKAAGTKAIIDQYADSNNLILCGMHFPEGGIADYRK